MICDNKVLMESLDEQLKVHICSILNTALEETVNGIIHALKHAGLESLSELQLVQEEDLILVLKPIQRRKLVKAWSELSPSDNNLVTGATEFVHPSFTPFQNASTDTNPMFMPSPNLPFCANGSNVDNSATATIPSYIPFQNTNITTNPVFVTDPYLPFYIPLLPPEIPSGKPLQNCKWTRTRCLMLLEIYAKYKGKLFSCSDVDKMKVWDEIAHEVQQTCSLNCSKLQCLQKVEELRCKYQTVKTQGVINEKRAIFLNTAKNAFESSENSASPSPEQSNNIKSLRSSTDKEYRLKLLQVYAKHKSEFTPSDIEESKIMEKVATELRESHLYDCNEVSCRFDLLQIKSTYEDTVKNKTNFKPYFFMEAQKIFGNENLGTSSYDVDKVQNNDKYIPPHLRKTENLQNGPAKSAKTVVSVSPEQSNRKKLQSCKNKQFRRKLLQVYGKYQTEFASPDIEDEKVWEKIVAELRDSHLFDCDESLCRFELLQIKYTYEDVKKKQRTSKPYFFAEAQKVFDNVENLDIPSTKLPNDLPAQAIKCNNKTSLKQSYSIVRLKSWKPDGAFRLNLLEVYAKYKAEFDLPDTKEGKVWEKIVTELRKKYYHSCSEDLCVQKLFELKRKYENAKKKNENTCSLFFREAQKAFEDIENHGTSSYDVDKVQNNYKYIPPHLRSTENQQNGRAKSAKTVDRGNVLKVSNLPEDVRISNLQELFAPFGTIAHLYTIRNESDESKCFAFITFLKQEDATEALVSLDGIEFNKMALKVEWAEPSQTDEISKV